MKKLGCILFIALWPGMALAQGAMDWAYPVTPKPEPQAAPPTPQPQPPGMR